ncbi:hypothetical protein [Paenilisteria rocourtiae]|uniref:Uncharacterized protein n=1 Tax=Listeria rocourtiae TaxID=647910 RepID=A0A4R6ZRJ5_9LIST|nr:hypothetical protein [Listeria rocourtiae]EUJ48397.1 hypothetical protein PROCOU_05603 [Listeria rocourtiae FSL F6-920]MBC1605888.1 hypothetical protein [Listeria rocourtiae]TDR54769.1 hypothetical protein DFP96_102364 [Listeria rocourtiae]
MGIWKRGLFWLAYIISGICFVLTIVVFIIGFFHHMHDTGGIKSVIQILETPITGFIKLTNGTIQKSVIEIILLCIVSYVLPTFFCIATHYIRKNKRLALESKDE